MSAARWLLGIALGLLSALFALQALQMVSALTYLMGPEAFAASPLLMAALGFKGVLMLINLLLMFAVIYALRRLRARRVQAVAPPPTPTPGNSP